jgi:serpin B
VRLVKAETARVQSPDVTDGQISDLVQGNNEFAFEMYREQGGSENLVFSPYSISLAFSMAYGGARGETEAQMARTLNFLPREGQHPAFNALDRRVSRLGSESDNSGTPFQLNVANAVWGQRGYPYEGAYLGTLARHYGAGLQTVDFGQTDVATEEINGWVAGETEGRIRDLLPPDAIDPMTRMVLTNAIYFKGSWASKFETSQTEDGPFTLSDGEEVTVPMMRQAERFPYAEGAGYQAVQLPYDEYDANMLIILPDEGGFGEVEERLGADLLDELNARLSDHRVGLTMPRFDFEEELKLIDLMKGLGLRLPFDPYGADFSGVTKKERLYIYEALHKATITVDEKGTEAAAATAVLDMPVSSVGPPVTVTLDRPFIFAIQERETGVILFLGRVTNPQG